MKQTKNCVSSSPAHIVLLCIVFSLCFGYVTYAEENDNSQNFEPHKPFIDESGLHPDDRRATCNLDQEYEYPENATENSTNLEHYIRFKVRHINERNECAPTQPQAARLTHCKAKLKVPDYTDQMTECILKHLQGIDMKDAKDSALGELSVKPRSKEAAEAELERLKQGRGESDAEATDAEGDTSTEAPAIPSGGANGSGSTEGGEKIDATDAAQSGEDPRTLNDCVADTTDECNDTDLETNGGAKIQEREEATDEAQSSTNNPAVTRSASNNTPPSSPAPLKKLAVLIPPTGGDPLGHVRSLADAWRKDGFEVLVLGDNDDHRDRAVEQIASIQGNKEIRIAGWSKGGVGAAELSRALNKRNIQVEEVALIDYGQGVDGTEVRGLTNAQILAGQGIESNVKKVTHYRPQGFLSTSRWYATNKNLIARGNDATIVENRTISGTHLGITSNKQVREQLTKDFTSGGPGTAPTGIDTEQASVSRSETLVQAASVGSRMFNSGGFGLIGGALNHFLPGGGGSGSSRSGGTVSSNQESQNIYEEQDRYTFSIDDVWQVTYEPVEFDSDTGRATDFLYEISLVNATNRYMLLPSFLTADILYTELDVIGYIGNARDILELAEPKEAIVVTDTTPALSIDFSNIISSTLRRTVQSLF